MTKRTRLCKPQGAWDLTRARELWHDGLSATRIASEVGASAAAVSKRQQREQWPRAADVAKARHGDGRATTRVEAGDYLEVQARRAESWRRRMVQVHMRVADAIEVLPMDDLDAHGRILQRHLDTGYKLFGLNSLRDQNGNVVNVNIGLLGKLGGWVEAGGSKQVLGEYRVAPAARDASPHASAVCEDAP